MDRRTFLKTVGVGTAVGAIGVLTPSTAWAASTPSVGFALGDTAPEIYGYDQYMRYWSNKDLVKGWTLLSFSAAWCYPCREAAIQLPSIVALLAANGVNLRVVELLIQDASLDPSQARNAEAWSSTFGTSMGPTLHCNGDPSPTTVPWYQLTQYDLAINGEGSAIPTYVLIDPRNVIRVIVEDWDDETIASIVNTVAPNVTPPAAGAGSTSYPPYPTVAPYYLSTLMDDNMNVFGVPAAVVSNVDAVYGQMRYCLQQRAFGDAYDQGMKAVRLLTQGGVDSTLIDTATVIPDQIATLHT